MTKRAVAKVTHVLHTQHVVFTTVFFWNFQTQPISCVAGAGAAAAGAAAAAAAAAGAGAAAAGAAAAAAAGAAAAGACAA